MFTKYPRVRVYSLSSVLDGLRHNAASYCDQQYYSHVIYEWAETNGRVRLARFRAVPTDGRRETGRLPPNEQRRVWNYLLVSTTPASYFTLLQYLL